MNFEDMRIPTEAFESEQEALWQEEEKEWLDSYNAWGETPLARTELLLGAENMEKLKRAKVILVGVGGVGSVCGETLCRSGIGKLHIIDDDRVSISNLNRQLIATTDVVGMPKTLAMGERLVIVSDTALTAAQERLTAENAENILPPDADYIVDAVDDVPAKVAIALWAQRHRVPVLSCMGTGNRLDPAKLHITDVFKTSGDPLARKLRSCLRKNGIETLAAVCSEEPPRTVPGQTVIGSFMPVTAAAGLIAAWKVMTDIMNKDNGKEEEE